MILKTSYLFFYQRLLHNNYKYRCPLVIVIKKDNRILYLYFLRGDISQPRYSASNSKWRSADLLQFFFIKLLEYLDSYKLLIHRIMKESVIKKRSNMRFVLVNFQNKVKNHGFQICSNNRVHASVYEIFVFFFFFCLKKKIVSRPF